MNDEEKKFLLFCWNLAHVYAKVYKFAEFDPKDAKWKFFHFGGKFSTFKKLQKKIIFGI